VQQITVPVAGVVVPAQQGPPDLYGTGVRSGGTVLRPAASDVHLLRRPVFHPDLSLAGYGLLVDGPAATDADRTTGLLDALQDAPTRVLGGGGVLLVRLTLPLLLGHASLPSPDGHLLLEVDEVDLDLAGTEPGRTAAAVDGLRVLARAGHVLCLVGSVWSPSLRPLLSLFRLARVDVSRVGSAGLAALATRLREHETALFVTEVTTLSHLDACRRVKARLVAGELVSRPPVVADEALSPGHVACLRLATALVRPDVDLTEVEFAVRSDPALTMRVLKAVNAASSGARQRVSSIRQAVVLLGPRVLLASVLTAGLLEGGATCPPEAVEAILVRAHMCELVATLALPDGLLGGAAGHEPALDGSAAFTVGLVSALDVLLGAPLVEIVAELPVDEAVEGAVLRHSGRLGAVLADVLAYEAGTIPRFADLATLRALYLSSLSWAAPLVAGAPA
jgi:EAL and modified HD-GYP domain-containing signal transduction protein